jgi:hypothetical protein
VQLNIQSRNQYSISPLNKQFSDLFADFCHWPFGLAIHSGLKHCKGSDFSTICKTECRFIEQFKEIQVHFFSYSSVNLPCVYPCVSDMFIRFCITHLRNGFMVRVMNLWEKRKLPPGDCSVAALGILKLLSQ